MGSGPGPGGHHDDDATRALGAPAGGGTDDARPGELAPGERVDAYRIVRLLGRGGMGEVYLADQLEPVRRTVALKLLRGRLDARLRALFEVERQVLARMQHPVIAQLHDAGTSAGGEPWFAMEYIAGEPVTDYCQRQGLGLRARLALFIRLCEGVQHAHAKGVVHRDLKPANLLVGTLDGRPAPKIIDFGIASASARLHGAGAAVERAGTPAYMSPEQLGDDPDAVDARCDVYALGVVLHELLTGERPPAPGDDRTTLRPPSQGLTRARVPAGVAAAELARVLRGELDRVLLKALARDPGRRYDSPAALADDLQRFLDGRPLQAVPATRGYVAAKFIGRHRLGLGAGAAVLAALVAGLVASMLALGEARRAEAEALARQAELARVVAFQRGMLGELDVRAMGAGLLALQVDALAPDHPALAEAIEAPLAAGAATDIARGLVDRYLLQRALQAVDRDFADQPRLAADLRSTVAGVQERIGAHAEALATWRAVAAALAPLEGPSAPATLRARRGELEALSALGRRDEAHALLDALAPGHAALPPGDPDRLVFERLRLRRQGGDGDRAGALAGLEALLAGAADVADPARRFQIEDDVRTDIAILRIGLGDVARARADFEAILAARRGRHPEGSSPILDAMANVASARGAEGDLAGSLAVVEPLVDGRARLLGRDHPDTLSARMNRAITLLRLGRTDEAEDELVAVEAAYVRLFGPAHPAAVRTRLNLGTLYARDGRHAEAAAVHRAVWEARRDSLGDDHPDTLRALSNRASTERDAGRLADAEASSRELRRRVEAALAPEDPLQVEAIALLASVRAASGDAASARALLLEAIELARARFGAGHPLTLRMGLAYGEFLRDRGDGEALEALRAGLLAPLAPADPAALPPELAALRASGLEDGVLEGPAASPGG